VKLLTIGGSNNKWQAAVDDVAAAAQLLT